MKTFKADNLKEILKIAEQAIVWPENFSDSSYAVFESLSDGNLANTSTARPDATSTFLSSMVNTLQRQIQQLEGHQYKYEALFLVEGSGRSKIRMILTKLGNAVDLRQERLAALEAKNKLAAEQTGLNALTAAISKMFAQPEPKTVSQDPPAYMSELKGLREMMALIGEVFDLYPSVVTSFEKQHQGTQERGSALTAEQLESLIPPLEEEDSPGLLRPERQRRYVPRGLVKVPVDEVKPQGARAELLVLTYESEFFLKLTRKAEDRLNPKWHNTLLVIGRIVPLPQRVRSSRVNLRWLAAIPNLTAIGVVMLAIICFYALTASSSSSSSADQTGQKQQSNTVVGDTKLLPETNSELTYSSYDPHVVYWEEPGRIPTMSTSQRFTRTAEPRYTIEVGDI
ncbi:hypothetical protein BGZ76_004667 [Entomortierella beljakovae]|nr:hypothetical protein BGZ76_004667 [Entomortierella beljakovae]